MKAKKLFFKECHLAGRQYYDVDEVWEKLKVGTIVRLVRELDNRYDPNAVAIMYDDKDSKGKLTGESFLLGYIPAVENETIAQFLDMGWSKCFSCQISKINPETHYENQIRLTIRICKNKEQ